MANVKFFNYPVKNRLKPFLYMNLQPCGNCTEAQSNLPMNLLSEPARLHPASLWESPLQQSLFLLER